MKITFIKRNGKMIPYADDDRQKIDEFKDGAIYEVDIKNMDKRTLAQNSSIHLWCKQIAEKLNKENFFIQDVIKINTEWNTIKVKEMLFKPVVMSLYTKDSTTKLNIKEFDLIIDTLVMYMAKKGVELPPFPEKKH